MGPAQVEALRQDDDRAARLVPGALDETHRPFEVPLRLAPFDEHLPHRHLEPVPRHAVLPPSVPDATDGRTVVHIGPESLFSGHGFGNRAGGRAGRAEYGAGFGQAGRAAEMEIGVISRLTADGKCFEHVRSSA
jgi:hypothetical protein